MSSLKINTTNSTQFNSSIITANLRSSVQMMSSKEIAELTGKEHKHVKRDIEVMLEQLNLDQSKFGRIYLDSMNRQQTEYALDKDLSICLVSGYNVQLRMAIIKRWNELEAQVLEMVRPSYMIEDPIERAKKWIEEATAKQAIEAKLIEAKQVIEVTQPKADVYDIIANRDNTYTIRDTAKLLKMRPKDLTDWLLTKGWIYGKTSATYKPFAAHDRNHLKLVASAYGTQVRVTGKGLVLLARKLKVELDSSDFE